MPISKFSIIAITFALLVSTVACSGGGGSTSSSPTPPSPPATFTPQDQSDVVYGSGLLNGGAKALLLDVNQSGDVCGTQRPFAVLIHGGSFRRGSKDMGYLIDLAERLTERGLVAVNINYRLTGDDPIPSSEFTPVRDELLNMLNQAPQPEELDFANTVASSFEDAVTAVRWVRSNADDLCVDPDRFVLVGNSAGSVIALHVAYALDEFSINLPKPLAVIDNWGQFIGGNYMSAGDPPLLIVHGEQDPIVDIQEALDLESEALSVGLPYSFYKVTDGGHGFDDIPIDTVTLDGETLESIKIDFILDHLNGAAATYEVRDVPIAGN